MKRFFVPGFALALGLAAFLWLQLRVLPQIAHSQSSDPREEHLIAELNAGKIAGAKGPPLADIIRVTVSCFVRPMRCRLPSPSSAGSFRSCFSLPAR